MDMNHEDIDRLICETHCNNDEDPDFSRMYAIYLIIRRLSGFYHFDFNKLLTLITTLKEKNRKDLGNIFDILMYGPSHSLNEITLQNIRNMISE